MARIKHIALTRSQRSTRKASGSKKDADVGANGPNYNGIHHFGFEVDDLNEASQRLEAVQAKRLT